MQPIDFAAIARVDFFRMVFTEIRMPYRYIEDAFADKEFSEFSSTVASRIAEDSMRLGRWDNKTHFSGFGEVKDWFAQKTTTLIRRWQGAPNSEMGRLVVLAWACATSLYPPTEDVAEAKERWLEMENNLPSLYRAYREYGWRTLVVARKAGVSWVQFNAAIDNGADSEILHALTVGF